MSTKIYEAYRIPLNKMGETLLFFKAQFMKSAIEEAKKLSTSLKEEYIQKGIDSFKSEWTGTSLSDEDIKKRVRIALALSLLIRSSKRGTVICNIDSFVKVFVDDKHAYFWAVGPLERNTSGIKNLPKYMKDYCYFNNTDKPEDISERKWAARAKKWNKFLSSGHPSLAYPVLTMKEPLETFDSIHHLCKELTESEDNSDCTGIYFLAQNLLEKEDEENKAKGETDL